MKIFIDTNIFISVIEGSDGSEVGKKLLNQSEYELCTSVLNLIEIRDVLMKKKHKPREFTQSIIEWLEEELDLIVEDVPDLVSINQVHQDRLLDPPDCIFYVMADEAGAVFSSFERELKDHGAKDPSELV